MDWFNSPSVTTEVSETYNARQRQDYYFSMQTVNTALQSLRFSLQCTDGTTVVCARTINQEDDYCS